MLGVHQVLGSIPGTSVKWKKWLKKKSASDKREAADESWQRGAAAPDHRRLRGTSRSKQFLDPHSSLSISAGLPFTVYCSPSHPRPSTSRQGVPQVRLWSPLPLCTPAWPGPPPLSSAHEASRPDVRSPVVPCCFL